MIVVGVGCGPGMLTVEAIAHLRNASRIFGSRRALEMAGPYIPPHCEVAPIEDYSRIGELPEDAVVLSTGDPMLSGLGHLGVDVVPGISSMQCAFSRLRLPLARAVVVDAHGKDESAAREEMLEEVSRGRIPFVLTGPEFDIADLARIMAERGIDGTIIVCEDLGYPAEVISFGDPKHPPHASSRLFSLILVKDR
ncbi:MAG: cobalt-precorrin-7 (C(5))-methyltransferase [Methanomassiliicoccus sp.]|nr:cobalt-precorrin-7 (C(5))-methyltransferase [Methanomassiliicoccus sp.]